MDYVCLEWVMAANMLVAAVGQVDPTSALEAPSSVEVLYRVTIGVRVTGRGGPGACTAATAVPIDWPEQKVKKGELRMARCKARRRNAGDSGAMLIVDVDSLREGEEASALYECEVTTTFRSVDLAVLVAPTVKRTAPEFRAFLAPSPGVESTDREVRKLARSLNAGAQSPWEQVCVFRDWARDEIRYEEMDFTSARKALDARVGDCEEKSALFVALCRASGIPARTVWSPGHVWAEVLLGEDAAGGGWITIDPTIRTRPGLPGKSGIILQKGDNIHLPERKGPRSRLLNNWYRSADPQPKVEFVQEIEMLAPAP